MIRSRRALLALVATLALVAPTVVEAVPAPTPLLGWPAWTQDQVVRYRWLAGQVPPPGIQDAFRLGVVDSGKTRYSRAPTFVFDAAGSSTVQYGIQAFCGTQGIACADGTKAPESFRIAFREQGHRFDWGALRWCALEAKPTNGCFDARMVTLHELGHVHGLNHYPAVPEAERPDSIMHSTSRSMPNAGWDAHAFGRCDVASLMTRYDMTSWTAGYSTCLDLAVDLTLGASATSIVRGTTITFTATLAVGDNPGDGRLSGNPVSARTVQLQRRLVGGTSWTAMGTLAPASAAGSYSAQQSPTTTYEWRAVFPEPATEGLRGAATAPVRVTVSGCSGSGCPQSTTGPTPATGRRACRHRVLGTAAWPS